MFEMISYIKKHWRGEYSLPVSYWLNTFLANLTLVLIVLVITYLVADVLNPYLILFALLSVYSTLFAIMVWQVIGTWRSAQNRKQRTGRKGWATAAQIALVIGVIQSVTVYRDGIKQIVETARVAFGTDEFANFETELKGGTDLYINGYITFKLAGSMEKFFQENPEIRSIHLNSGGGRLSPARHIAELVLSKKLNTYTHLGCLSACTIVFLAGDSRIINVGAKLGFHSGSMPGVSQRDMQFVQRKEFHFLQRRGVPNSFISKALNTPGDKMWFPTYRELMNANILTHVRIGNVNIPISNYCKKENCDEHSTAPQWLQETAAAQNLKLPSKLDAVTVFNRIETGPDKLMTYIYTLATSDVYFDTLDKSIKNLACVNSKLDVFFGNGISMQWRYLDQNGKVLYEVRLSPVDCEEYRRALR